MAFGTPRFQRLAERSRGAPEPPPERCELCAQPVPPVHRHLLDLGSRELRCACRACAVLFDRRAAGGGVHRLVPDRCWYLPDLALDDTAWHSIPVGLAFLFHHSTEDRVVALYPSPAGPAESALGPRAWAEMAAANPVLRDVEPDVEALLVNRARDAREQWLVPIDACYTLVGIVRTRWKGLGGGEEVWAAVDGFFANLRRRSRTVRADGSRPDADQK
jgi:hypothetical protein